MSWTSKLLSGLPPVFPDSNSRLQGQGSSWWENYISESQMLNKIGYSMETGVLTIQTPVRITPFIYNILIEKGALSPKSFAKIVRLNQSISFFTINSCPKTNLFHTEEWVKLELLDYMEKENVLHCPSYWVCYMFKYLFTILPN